MESASICYAVKWETAACGQYTRAYLPCGQSAKSYTTSLYAGQFRTLSTVSGSQPRGPVYSACSQDGAGGGTCNQPMQRGPVWHDASHAATDPCSPVHAAPGELCKFAQIRALQALQTRPISTTQDALQELHADISNGLAAFLTTPRSAAQSRPPARS